MDIELPKIFLQGIVTFAAAYWAAHLVGGRFRNDRWWERKAAAYSELVTALHHMKMMPSECLDAHIEGRDMADVEKENLWSKYKDARRNVLQIADASEFLVAVDVGTTIRGLERELGKAKGADSWFDHVEQEYNSISDYLDRIKNIARRDLML